MRHGQSYRHPAGDGQSRRCVTDEHYRKRGDSILALPGGTVPGGDD